jgi:hypothetical protein
MKHSLSVSLGDNLVLSKEMDYALSCKSQKRNGGKDLQRL